MSPRSKLFCLGGDSSVSLGEGRGLCGRCVGAGGCETIGATGSSVAFRKRNGPLPRQMIGSDRDSILRHWLDDLDIKFAIDQAVSPFPLHSFL
jgi:hypothetical protein